MSAWVLPCGAQDWASQRGAHTSLTLQPYLYDLGYANPIIDGHVAGIQEGLALQHRVEDPGAVAGRAAGGRTQVPALVPQDPEFPG